MRWYNEISLCCVSLFDELSVEFRSLVSSNTMLAQWIYLHITTTNCCLPFIRTEATIEKVKLYNHVLIQPRAVIVKAHGHLLSDAILRVVTTTT
jgi:hypothetical protein